MRGGGFTFKQFHVDHSRCAMKVGTDGVLIGAWCRLPQGPCRILDIGTGSGLMALMAAQRRPEARITGIDIDPDCAAQARENAAASPWSDRIAIEHRSLQELDAAEKFDAAISNPPYFVDSLLPPDAARTSARHTVALAFDDIVSGVERNLHPHGAFSLILPPAEMELFRAAAHGRLFLRRRCDVFATSSGGVKRVMAEFGLLPPADAVETETLTIEDAHGYTDDYRRLTCDFYLKF